MSDALPYTPEDIAAQAIAAADAGASILHLHARRPHDGGVSINPDDSVAFLPVVKQATHAVINISTGGSLKNTIEERIAPALTFSPKMCSMNMGSMNFSFHPLAGRYPDWKFDWEKDYVANSDTYIFRNTFADIRNAATQLSPHGIKFEHECYDVGHLYNLKFCMDVGLFKAPIFIQFIFGILGGVVPEVDNLIFMKRTADRLFGDDYRWSVLGAGGADGSGHDGEPDGRERPCGARGQSVYQPRQTGRKQRATGAKDSPHHRGSGLQSGQPRRGARHSGPERRRPRRILIRQISRRGRGQRNLPRPFAFAGSLA